MSDSLRDQMARYIEWPRSGAKIDGLVDLVANHIADLQDRLAVAEGAVARVREACDSALARRPDLSVKAIPVGDFRLETAIEEARGINTTVTTVLEALEGHQEPVEGPRSDERAEKVAPESGEDGESL